MQHVSASTVPDPIHTLARTHGPSRLIRTPDLYSPLLASGGLQPQPRADASAYTSAQPFAHRVPQALTLFTVGSGLLLMLLGAFVAYTGYRHWRSGEHSFGTHQAPTVPSRPSTLLSSATLPLTSRLSRCCPAHPRQAGANKYLTSA